LTGPAPSAPAATAPGEVQQADLDNARQALSADTGLSETQKQDANDLLQKAVTDLGRYDDARRALRQLQQQIADAPHNHAQELAQARLNALDTLVTRYGQYIGSLAQQDLAQRQLVDEARRHAGRRLAAITRKTRRIRIDSFWLTLEALWITVALASLPALLFVLPALALLDQGNGHPFTLMIAGAALNIGIMLANIGLLQAICRDHGLGDRHLKWPLPVRQALLRETRWILPAILVPGLVIGATSQGNAPEAAQALGQLAFVLLMGVLFIAIMRLLGSQAPSPVCASARPSSPTATVMSCWCPTSNSSPARYSTGP
jgi:hypothetical protein